MKKNVFVPTKLTLPLPLLNKEKNEVLAINSEARYDYDNDKRQWTDHLLGYDYTILLAGQDYNPFTCRISETTPSIPPEAFENADSPLKVKLDGFSAKVYKNKDGYYALSCTATGIKLVQEVK